MCIPVTLCKAVLFGAIDRIDRGKTIIVSQIFYHFLLIFTL